MAKQFQPLFAGCVRQKGDEVRKTIAFWSGENNYTGIETDHIWHPVSLLNHTILQSDLMVAEFRRPV